LNFTYHVKGASEPPQQLLQRFSYFVVVVLTTEETEIFALEQVMFELRAASALCWVIQFEDLKTAAPGTALARMHALLLKHNMHSEIEHSFVAAMSKDDIVKGIEDAGFYASLNLLNIEDANARSQAIHDAVGRALKHTEVGSKRAALEAIKVGVSVASLVKGLFRF